MNNGSRLEGIFGTADGDGETWIFETEKGSAWGEKRWRPERSEAAALVFSSRLRASAEKQLAGVHYFRMGLADGSLILMPISDPAWEARMNEIPLEAVTYLEAPPQSMNYINTDLTAATEDAPRIRWLDELSPIRFTFDSHFGECGFPWSYGRNASVSGTRLQTNGILFPHGFGMLPGMDLTFPLDGKFRRFVVFPALDDTTALGTAARFRILADDAPRAEIEVHVGDAPRCVLVDVAGVRELRLLVENPDGTSPRQPPARGSWLRGVLIP